MSIHDDWNKLWNITWNPTQNNIMAVPEHVKNGTDLEDTYYNILNFTNNSGELTYSEPYDLHIIIPLTIIYSVILVCGVFGNISICIVISRNRSMHTTTNFYLYSLAISDLLLLLCGLPLEIYRLWNPYIYPFGNSFCVAVGLAQETSTNATVLTITAFTIERYIAICRPFMSHTMSKLSRAVKLIIAIWLCALCAAIPQAMQFGLVRDTMNGQNISICTVKGRGVHQVFLLSSLLFFVAPMFLITMLYVMIGIKLRTSRILHPTKKMSVESHGQERSAQTPKQYKNGASQRRVIRMLVAVALSFFICWAPFHVQRLLAMYGNTMDEPTDSYYMAYLVLTYVSGVLYFLSTAINPFLYNIMSNKFRNAFKMTLAACCRRRHPNLGRTYSALLASRRQKAAQQSADRARGPRRLRGLSTPTTHGFDPTPRCQCHNGRNLSIVNEMPSGSDSLSQPRRRYRDYSDSCASPQSISNSSLREVDKDGTSEELATYMSYFNGKIDGIT